MLPRNVRFTLQFEWDSEWLDYGGVYLSEFNAEMTKTVIAARNGLNMRVVPLS